MGRCASVFARASFSNLSPDQRPDPGVVSDLRPALPGISDSERDLVVAAMKSFEGQRYQLAAYVVMDDQVHALLTPFAGYELKAILHSCRSPPVRCSASMGALGGGWQDESFDRIVRDDGEFAQKIDYIGLPVGLLCPDGDVPKGLRQVANFVRHISKSDLANSQFPDPVIGLAGQKIHKPPRW